MDGGGGRDNRTIILDRAEALFARSGYDAIGVQEIVTAAGVTKPTLYHYFGSKAGVLSTLFAERFEPFLVDLDRAAAVDESLTGRLQRIVEVCFTFARSHTALYRIYLASCFGSPDNEAVTIVRAYIQRQHRILRELFASASARNGNMRGRERVYASTLIGAINGRIALSFDERVPLDDHAVWQTVQHFSYGIHS